MDDLVTTEHLDTGFWIALIVLHLLAAATDVRRFRIPNAIPIAVASVFALRVVTLGLWDLAIPALLLGAAVLSVGFLLFALRWLGGGDVKLITALSLWAGPDNFFLIVYTIALSGGLMALGLLVSLTLLAVSAKVAGKERQGSLIRGRRIPYGVAIAAGAIHLSFDRIGVL